MQKELRSETIQATVTKRTKKVAMAAMKGKSKTLSDYINRLILLDTSAIKFVSVDITGYILRHMPKNIVREGKKTTVEISGLISCKLIFDGSELKTFDFASSYEEIQECSIKFDKSKIEKHLDKYY